MTTTRHERGGSVLKIKTGIAIAISGLQEENADEGIDDPARR
jgi:hypothetical protein